MLSSSHFASTPFVACGASSRRTSTHTNPSGAAPGGECVGTAHAGVPSAAGLSAVRPDSKKNTDCAKPMAAIAASPMSVIGSTCMDDDAICAWYEAQTEETLSYLFDRFGASTPRQCWLSFHRDCSLPAVDSAASLPAPAAGQVGGNLPRNQAAWMSIADFLTLENLRAVLAARLALRPWASWPSPMVITGRTSNDPSGSLRAEQAFQNLFPRP